MQAEALELEEFAAWLRAWGYRESTIKRVIIDLRAFEREGMNTLSRHTARHRRYALRLYQRFLSMRSV